MNINSMWVPLIASVGVGAATYYSVSKNSQNFNEALQEVLPVVSHMSNGGNENSSNFQDATNMLTDQSSSNQPTGNSSGNQSAGNTEQLGPYGMS